MNYIVRTLYNDLTDNSNFFVELQDAVNFKNRIISASFLEPCTKIVRVWIETLPA